MESLSVIIPVKNGGRTLEKCLSSIRNQTIQNIEIIILDSMSDDDSREISLKYDAKIIDIPAGTFNHGLTRNIGVKASSCELLYFTVQDAWLSENDLLEKMVRHLKDHSVMAVVGHQATPWGHLDKNPAYWYKRFSDTQVILRYFPKGEFTRLTNIDKFKNSRWDNVVSMYRKSALLSIPFAKTDFSEDWMWANEALANGYKLLDDTSIVVYHYHHMNFYFRYKLQFTISFNFYSFFGVKPNFPISIVGLMRNFKSVLIKREVSLFSKPYWLLHNTGIFIADFLAISVFKTLLFFGGDNLLMRGYKIISKRIPQGKLKSINEK